VDIVSVDTGLPPGADSTKLFTLAGSSNFLLLNGYNLLEVLIFTFGVFELGSNDFRNGKVFQR
jgi:hypothetical protein